MSKYTIDKKFIVDRQGKPAVLFAGLLETAHTAGLKSIRTRMLQAPADENRWTAIFYAEVEMGDGGVFTGTGDANLENVARMVAPHYIRMAETRAKARALRDALSITAVAAEELGEDVDRNAGEITSKPAKPTTPTSERIANTPSPGFDDLSKPLPLNSPLWTAPGEGLSARIEKAKALGIDIAALASQAGAAGLTRGQYTREMVTKLTDLLGEAIKALEAQIPK